MTVFFEIRQRLILIYSKYERYLKALLKAVHAYLLFFFIGKATGYDPALCSPVVSLALSLVCAMLPSAGISVLASGMLVLQFAKVSPELALVTACVLLIAVLLSTAVQKGKAVWMAAALLACLCKCPGIFMVAAGLAAAPGALFPACFGVLLYTLIELSKNEYSVLFSQTSTLSSLERVSFILNGVMHNAGMWLTLVSMLLVITVVYMIRRMKVNYAWTIAIGSGTLLYVILMLIGTYAFDIRISILTCILNGIAAMAVSMLLQLFWFAVDYTRTEYVQFEDEEYYYYVKAVPKITVAFSNRKVKHITETTGVMTPPPAEDAEGVQDGFSRDHIVCAGIPAEDAEGVQDGFH